MADGKAELHNRLQNLIQRSNIYVSFISKKLEAQQAALKAAAEKEEAAAAKKEAEAAAHPKTEDAEPKEAEATAEAEPVVEEKTTRRTTRKSAAADTPSIVVDPPKKGAKGKAKTAAKPKSKQTKLTDVFSKKDLPIGQPTPVSESVPKVLGEQPDLRPAQQPRLITGGVMKPYQLEGLYWLVSLYENGLNGILADEMGLGKTLQTISFLAFLKEKKVHGPFLIAAPVSTLSNWVEEIGRFAPEMNVVMYHGTPEHRESLRNTKMKMNKASMAEFPVVCTSYEIVMKDRKFLEKYRWKYIIIDEGHRIKNLNCKLIKELKSYSSANRLLLTGTPLQNNLSELWSLLNFLLPEVFDDLDFFQEYFDFSAVTTNAGDDGDEKTLKEREEFIKQEREANMVGKLHALLKPFLLRRVKTDVMMDLPRKKEYVLYAPLSNTQKELYGRLLNRDAREWLLERLMTESANFKETLEPKKPGPSKSKKRKLLSVDDTESGSSTPAKRSRPASPESNGGLDTPTSMTSGGPSSSLRIRRPKSKGSYRELEDDEWFDQLSADEAEAALPPTPITPEDIEAEQERQNILSLTRQVNNKKLQNLLMQLRQVCDSPHLFYWPFPTQFPRPESSKPVSEDDEEHDSSIPPLGTPAAAAMLQSLTSSSGKILLLSRLLPALLERGHKVLLFSQFSTMLDLLSTWLSLQSLDHCRIDGSIAQDIRRQEIKRFNESADVKVFLLSTRAAGLGINLTSADTVILVDSDWNPMVDAQAMDRAHRIGQTRPVIVYRLATGGTVEATMLAKAEGKRRLERLVIKQGNFGELVKTAGAAAVQSGEEAKVEVNDFSEDILKEEFEKVKVVESSDGGMVLGDEELERLLDRSDEAFDRQGGEVAVGGAGVGVEGGGMKVENVK